MIPFTPRELQAMEGKRMDTIPEPANLGEEARHTKTEPAAAHTPGPWRSEDTNGAKLSRVVVSAVVGANGSTVVIGNCSGPDKEANARLIAAAPDQHAACREARAVFGKLDLAKLHAEDSYLHAIVRHAMDTLDAAIAKATDPDRLNKMGRG